MIVCNPIVIAVILVLGMCIARINVVVALAIGAITCGVIGGHSIQESVKIFSDGLGGGAKIALSYAMLGAFASALAHSGLPNFLMSKIVDKLHGKKSSDSSVSGSNLKIKIILLAAIGAMSVMCKNAIPVHIAFIPILIPPLLGIFNKLSLDRRAIACIITFGLIVSYMLIPFGFGEIFLHDILMHSLDENGLNVSLNYIIRALSLPALGMFIGLIIALIRYRKSRKYQHTAIENTNSSNQIPTHKVIVPILSVLSMLIIQILYREIVLSAIGGFLVLSIGGVIDRKSSDNVVVDGFKMIAMISFTMIAAAGFGHVVRESGGITELINWIAAHTMGSKALAAFGMLIAGLLISIGIGSSFSTVPIVASVYVPLGLKLGFSPAAIAIIITVSGVVGDAGSPASDSTLGPTMGLNADGQHSLVRDTSIPTFLHLSIPAFVCGWLSAVLL